MTDAWRVHRRWARPLVLGVAGGASFWVALTDFGQAKAYDWTSATTIALAFVTVWAVLDGQQGRADAFEEQRRRDLEAEGSTERRVLSAAVVELLAACRSLKASSPTREGDFILVPDQPFENVYRSVAECRLPADVGAYLISQVGLSGELREQYKSCVGRAQALDQGFAPVRQCATEWMALLDAYQSIALLLLAFASTRTHLADLASHYQGSLWLEPFPGSPHQRVDAAKAHGYRGGAPWPSGEAYAPWAPTERDRRAHEIKTTPSGTDGR